MSVVTHVIPQFSDGQIFITPTVQQSQDIVVAQHGPVLTVPLTTALAPVQTIQLQTKLDPEIEREKQEIYKHPLFPLMALMFERCEQASSTPDFTGMDSFDSDIQAFVRHQEKENKSLLVENEELNNLMIKAIQVLRIHLMELEKVSDLCKDFCTRYTNCLKGKLQSENLLRTESDYDQSMFDEPPPETPTKPSPNIATSSPGNVILQQPFQPSLAAMPTLGPGQLMSGGTVYQMVQTAQGLVAQPVQIQPTITSIAPPLIHGGTPLSQLGVPAPPVSSTNASPNSNIVNNLMSPGGFDSDDEDSSKKKNKRGVLPKSATQIMKSWLFQHIVHPYPTEDEKRQIASQTNLTLLQVNNWFINARHRILQPMLDAGNPDQSKAKKAKPQSKPSQRFINARRRILQPMLDAGNPDQSKAKKAKPQSKPSQRFWPFTTSSSDSSSGTSVKSEPDGQTIILPPHTFVGQSREPSLPEGVTGPLFTAVRIATPPSPGTNEKDNNSDNNNNNNQNTDNDHSEMSENEELT